MNQPVDSCLAKSCQGIWGFYKLIVAISTAAPNKPKRRSKKEAANRASTGRKFKQKPPTSHLHLLNHRQRSWLKEWNDSFPMNPAWCQQHVKLQKLLILLLPLWGVCSQAKGRGRNMGPIELFHKANQGQEGFAVVQILLFHLHIWDSNPDPASIHPEQTSAPIE